MNTSATIQQYPFKSGLAQEFEVVSIEELYQKHADLLCVPHRTSFYHIMWFTEGAATHHIDFKPIKIQPNTVLFLHKDTVKQFSSADLLSGNVIFFTDSFFAQTSEDTQYLNTSILFNDFFTIAEIQPKEYLNPLCQTVELIKAEFQKNVDHSQSVILKNLLHNFLLLSERERRKQAFTKIKKGPEMECLMQFKGLVDKHFHSIKQVSAYAEKMNITEKKLLTSTNKILGKSPKEMIDERITLEAKRLLAYTHLSVKEIGFELGFDEPTNFVKYFRKNATKSPMEFRESSSLT
jgi:AraC-like DNA-binding protein